MECKHTFRSRILALLERLVVSVERFVNNHTPAQLTVVGGSIVFTLPNNFPDVPFTVSSVTAVDEEGEAVALTESLTSSDEGVLSFVYGEGSSASNPRAASLHIGHSGLASVEYTAKDPKGNLVKSGGGQFTITTGDVAVTTGGDLVFEWIVED